MPELLEKHIVHIKRALLKPMNGGVRAQDFEVEAVPIESNNVREIFKLCHQFFHVLLKPSPEAVVLVPGHSNGDSERADVRPAALYLVRQPQRFNVQIDFAIE